MATPNLAISHIASNQASKEVTANSGFDELDKALTNLLNKAFPSDADYTLTTGENGEALANMVFNFSGTISVTRNVIVPTNKKLYIVKNTTTGGNSIVVKTGSGTGVTVVNGSGYQVMYCDGTNVVPIVVLNPLQLSGLISVYNNINTISNGVPAEYATVDLTAQGAAIAATTLYNVPAGGAGMYRISWVAKVTRAASVSSTLGGTNGFQIVYTDNDDSVVTTSPRTGAVTDNGNTTVSVVSGEIVVNAKASTTIQYKIDYTSSGATTMQFNLHIKLEAL